MKNTKTKRMLAVAALLAVGLALMLYYAAHKQGYHVDELYTYELANYPGGFYALEDGYMDSWHDGSFYSAVLTPGRLFDYTIPWNNQKIDVHPPLYYCLIYTAESLFPQLGLPWVGLLPNFVCILAGAAGGAKAAAGGLAGSVCGHNGRGADAVFLFGVLLFRLRAVWRLAAGCAAVQDGGRLCDRRVCRAGCGVCGLPHDEGPYLLRLPRKRGVCERL